MSEKEYMSDKEYVAHIPNLSNKKLIDGLESCGHDNYYNVLYYPILKEIKKRLSKERKMGEWIEYPACLAYEGAYSDTDIVCSACHHIFNIIDNCTEEFAFCPHCGADMRGE